jgi:putative inorganic carbon (HCO3(-)) transporter
MRELLALRAGTLWRFFESQGFAYWSICAYLIVEYVRPQQLFSVLSGLPLGRVTLGAALVAQAVSGRGLRVKGAGSVLILLFTAVIFASSAVAYDPATATAQWWTWLSWLAVYFLIVNIVNTEERLTFFLVLWLLFHYYMSQGGTRQFANRGFRFAAWGLRGAPGWFDNSGEFGIAMCMFLPVAWHFYLASKPHLTRLRRWFLLGMPVTAILCIIGSSSRGALLGFAAVAFWTVMRSRKRFVAIFGVGVVVAVGWLVLPEGQKQRLTTMGEDSTSTRRLTYWRDGLEMAREHPALGVGYNNWKLYYNDHYVDRRTQVSGALGYVQEAHNMFIQCVAELGYAGLAALGLMIGATFWTNYRTRQRARASPGPTDFIVQLAYGLDGALVGCLVSGFFISILYYPFFWVNLAMTVALGAIARRRAPAGAPHPVPGQRRPGFRLVRRPGPRA